MPITPTVTKDLGVSDGSLYQSTWALVTATADGVPFECPEWADRTVHVSGTFGGATCTIQGSNDNSNWFSLHQAHDGSVAAFTAAGMCAILENPRYIRPNLTVAGVGATVNVILLARRANPMRT